MSTGGAKWIKQVKHEIATSFKKIRTTKNNGKKIYPNVNSLFSKREVLKHNIYNSKSMKKDEIEALEGKIKDIDMTIE